MSELRFTNNSVIYALPATGLIIGFSEVDRIIANEVRDIPDDAFPTLIYFVNGEEVERQTGIAEVKEIESRLEELTKA
ncbi:MAG: hypothetical protein GTN80_11340 [Nitrososphaeria archaeon]|nr:hypothetical protein [Nitrososphaeria archaeon]NIN52512.1 hypothetical protein [Nitrososphaeria archaeon]NIQ34211.1 hypothetical protein [Nitrososphaeria archaeon]